MNKLRRVLDIEIYPEPVEGDWHQEKYLVHGIDDSLWTSNKQIVADYILDELRRLEQDETL
jgi:hypothetical protein